jgi:hypothetical protein
MGRNISRRQKYAKHVTVKGERDTGEEHQEQRSQQTKQLILEA